MDPVRQPPHHQTKKPPPSASSYATEEEEELEREIAMRDPDLAALMSRANNRRQQQDPSFVHSFKQSQIGEAGGGEAISEGDEEEEEEGEEEEGKTVVTFADTREYIHEEEEEDPAETEEMQEETEDMVEPEEDVRVPRQYARQNHEYEEKLMADAERLAQAPSSEQASDDDQTEGEEDEDEESVYSDAAEEEEYPTDPLVIEELEKFQTTFRGIEKRFRLINKIGEGLKLLLPLCGLCAANVIQGPSARCTKPKTCCTTGSTIAGTSKKSSHDLGARGGPNTWPSKRST
jgi:hypothetical protein